MRCPGAGKEREKLFQAENRNLPRLISGSEKGKVHLGHSRDELWRRKQACRLDSDTKEGWFCRQWRVRAFQAGSRRQKVLRDNFGGRRGRKGGIIKEGDQSKST